MPSLEEEELAVFPQLDDDSDSDDSDDTADDDDDDDDDDDVVVDQSHLHPSPSPATLAPPPPPPAASGSVPAPANPNPNPAPQNGVIQVQPASATPSAVPPADGQITPATEERRLVPVSAGYDDSRRLFQRLWTDEDELVILQGFLDFVSQRGTIDASHQHDTGPFYEQIKARLQLDFSKNQLIEKLRRLKKKFRNVVSRIASSGKDFAFKSPHEQATFEIARKIWSSALKRSREIDDDDILNVPIGGGSDVKIEDGAVDASRARRRRRRYATMAAVDAGAAVGVPVEAAVNHKPMSLPPSAGVVAPIPRMIEETVRSCLSPLFKELIGSAAGGPGMNLMIPLSFNSDLGSMAAVAADDDKWRKQQILELEVYLKRVELVQDQIKKTLEDLRAMGS